MNKDTNTLSEEIIQITGDLKPMAMRKRKQTPIKVCRKNIIFIASEDYEDEEDW